MQDTDQKIGLDMIKAKNGRTLGSFAERGRKPFELENAGLIEVNRA